MHIALFEACSLEDVTADNRWIFSLHIEFDYSENLAMNQSIKLFIGSKNTPDGYRTCL